MREGRMLDKHPEIAEAGRGAATRSEGGAPKIAERRLAEIDTKRPLRFAGSARHRKAVAFLLALGGGGEITKNASAA